MSKFKVGDKVKIINQDWDDGLIGNIIKIDKDGNNETVYILDIITWDWFYTQNELELVKEGE